MINFAHRGASGTFPENTLLAFEEAINIKASGIELDVHKTKDKKLVVIHDEDIARTFYGKGLVKDFTLEELKNFKCREELFRDNERCKIPTLEEVLDLIKETNLILNIEIKTDNIHYEGIEKDVIDLINRYSLNKRVILSSFNHKTIQICKEIDKDITTGMLYDKPLENVIEYAKNIKADAIHPDKRLVSKELIEEAHKSNIDVNIYTVKEIEDMERLKEYNADGVFTDYPERLKEIL